MALRPDSPPAENLAEPRIGEPSPSAAGGRRQLPWWRLRSWTTDLDLLTRLRDGLRALPDDPAPDAGPASAGPEAAAGLNGGDAAAAGLAADGGAADGRTAEGRTDGSSAAKGGAAEGRTAESRTAESRTAEGRTAESRTAESRTASSSAAEGSAADAAPGGAAAGQSGAAGAPGPDPAMAAIQETFARMGAAGDDAAAFFYGWLFSRNPALRDLFPPAMDEQRDRLLVALTRIVESLSTPEEMAKYLVQLGRDHRKYSVQPAMYEAVGEALIATLRAFSGSAFTAEAEAAWTQAYRAACSIMIRAAEEDSSASPATWTAEVVEREERGHGIAVLTVEPDQELPFEPGQHLTVQTPRWPHVWRSYSIACSPRDDGLIQFHVRAVPGGWVSNALVSYTEPGDQLILGPPLGDMTLRHAGDRDLLCVAGGTGLSPLKSIVEQVIKDSAAGKRRRVFLYYGARRREELYDLRALWRLVDACDGLELTPVTSDDPAFGGLQGNVSRVAARYMPHRECEAYLSGPPAMVREALRVLGKAGIPRSRMHFDDALLAGRHRVGTGT